MNGGLDSMEFKFHSQIFLSAVHNDRIVFYFLFTQQENAIFFCHRLSLGPVHVIEILLWMILNNPNKKELIVANYYDPVWYNLKSCFFSICLNL